MGYTGPASAESGAPVDTPLDDEQLTHRKWWGVCESWTWGGESVSVGVDTPKVVGGLNKGATHLLDLARVVEMYLLILTQLE